jgi:hypothetical protein
MNQLQSNNSTILSDKVKKTYSDLTEKLLTIEPYSEEEFFNMINYINLDQYKGKTKQRTMIKDDIRLYKSVIYYTDALRNDLKKKDTDKMFWCERLLLCQNNLKIDSSMLCSCGSKSAFDKQYQKFSKIFCPKCWIPPTSKRWYQFKYGDEWEVEYKKFHSDDDRQKARKITGRKSWFVRKGNKFKGCLCKGKNETKILDFIENKHDIKIDRGVPIIGYYVDGYCENNNTIYEVYEKYHSYKQEYDEYRRIELMEHLNCKFVILYDMDEKNLEEITIKRYDKTES